MNKLQTKAINLLKLIEDKEKRYHDVNKTLSEIGGDFAPRVQISDSDVMNMAVGLLDEVLGDEIASYYLWECRNMNKGGKIVETDGTEYPIRTINDVKNYVGRKK